MPRRRCGTCCLCHLPKDCSEIRIEVSVKGQEEAVSTTICVCDGCTFPWLREIIEEELRPDLQEEIKEELGREFRNDLVDGLGKLKVALLDDGCTDIDIEPLTIKIKSADGGPEDWAESLAELITGAFSQKEDERQQEELELQIKVS